MDPSAVRHALSLLGGVPDLTLDLVLDRAQSMDLWARTVHGLRETLSRGPLPDLRVRTVDTSAPGELRTGDTVQPVPGQRVLLLVSDCVAPAWHDGRAHALLDEWCRFSATAVVQPLPPSLRHRVGVPLAPFHWSAARPVTPTAWLTCGLQPGSLEEAAGLEADCAVPVLGLEDGRSFTDWARLVAARTADGYDGEGMPLGLAPGAWDGLAAAAPPTGPAAQVRTLEAVAGPAAVRLAALLAVAPLVTLDLMRATQRSLLPEAEEAVAEVFHSGLLVRAPDRDRDVEGQRALVLVDGAVDLLTEILTRSDRSRSRDLAEEFLPPEAWARNTRPVPSSVRPSDAVRRDGPALRVRSALPARNHRFVGRTALLDTVRSTLHRSDGDGLCVLHGLAGVGKTQTALEYAHRHRGDYDFVWWTQARDARGLGLALARLGEELSVPPGPDGLAPVEDVLDRLRTGRVDRGWLLVLDNADPPARLTPMLPLGAGHILITSRHISWTEETAHPLRVAPLSRQESLALLRARAPWLTDDEGYAVAERAGYLPPLLIQLGRSLSKRRLDVAEHLAGFDRLCAKLLLAYGLPDYDVKLAVVWKQAVTELAAADPDAGELLRVLSCLGTGPVPYELLSAATGSKPSAGSDGVLYDKFALHLALMRLSDEDLATVEGAGGPVEVHPALQTVMRGVVMRPDEYETAEEAALGLLSAALPADPGTPSGRARMTEIARRLDLPAALRAQPERTYDLVLAVIDHHAAVGDTRAAGRLARAALDVWSRRFGADSVRIAALRAHAEHPSPSPSPSSFPSSSPSSSR
ncbi:FxSxx-COOH system tetratricopeptide repeat protein [Streptomyces griseoruber]|uniref:FxSxx-COOH system tetratricopeptide repeat protein n=1 Tax=Streptomyces griseoruber TaxID=1943 RepID=UPI0037AF8B6D